MRRRKHRTIEKDDRSTRLVDRRHYAPIITMQLDQYTPDAITRSMGLGSFLDSTWDTSAFLIRILLKPSLHPEFCLDINLKGSAPEISAVCLSEMLWNQMAPRPLPAFHERKPLDQANLNRIQSLCSTINREAEQPICVDGMGVNVAWTNNGEMIRFDSHVYAELVSEFVRSVLEIAWNNFVTSRIRNGIANCGKYVGLSYPLEPEPPKPTQLLVLGNPDDVSEYFELIRKHKDGA